MTIRKVQPGRPQAVDPIPLQLSWQADGPRSVELRVERTDSPGHPAPGVHELDGDRRLIESVSGPIVASVRPVGEPVFPDGTLIHTQLATTDGAAQYAMSSLDVSGTQKSILFTITPEAGKWTLLVPLTAPPMSSNRPKGITEPERDPKDLPPVAQSAVYRVRQLVGPTGEVPVESRTEVHLAVDQSASMLPHVRSGARRTILELVLGVNVAVGLATDIPVWRLGRAVEQVNPPLSGGSIEGYDDYLGELPYTTGTAMAPLVRAASAGRRRRLVIVVSDGVPADIEDLRSALAETEPEGETRWHLLALARSVEDPEVIADPWKDELAPLSELASRVFSYSAITPLPPDNANWLEEALADSEQGRATMLRIVSGLAVTSDAP